MPSNVRAAHCALSEYINSERNQALRAAQLRNILASSSKISCTRLAAWPVFMYDNAHLIVCTRSPKDKVCKLIYSLQAVRNWHP